MFVCIVCQWSKFLQWTFLQEFQCFVGTFVCGLQKKNANMAKRRACKNLVLHGRFLTLSIFQILDQRL